MSYCTNAGNAPFAADAGPGHRHGQAKTGRRREASFRENGAVEHGTVCSRGAHVDDLQSAASRDDIARIYAVFHPADGEP